MRKLVRQLRNAILAVGLLAAMGYGTLAVSTAFAIPGCRCPEIYAPVTCDNGKTYPNQCFADCHHAKNCVPSGGL